jgi:hypothetical protein
MHGPCRVFKTRRVLNDFITVNPALQVLSHPHRSPQSVHRTSAMAPVKKEKAEVSAFERKRLENIAANQAMLKELSKTAEKIIPQPKPIARAKPSAPRKKAIPVKREAPRPTRASLRLSGVEADSETAKRKAEVEETFAKETAKAKRLRVSGDLNFSDVVVDGKKWNRDDGFLAGIMRGADPGYRTFTQDDIKETTDEGLKALREKMSGLDLYEGWEPNRES